MGQPQSTTKAKAQWMWQSNADPWSSEQPKWEPYGALDNDLLEKAYLDNQIEADLGDYIVSFKKMRQFKKGDRFRQRQVQRNVQQHSEVPEQKMLNEEEKNSRKERFFGVERPKTYNNVFGSLGDFIFFFENRGPEVKKFADTFHEIEISQDFNRFNQDILPPLIDSIKKESLKVAEENAKKGLQLIKLFQKVFTSFPEFYGAILKAYSMSGFLYKNLNKYLRDEEWTQLDCLLPYAFCLCKSFLCQELIFAHNIHSQQQAVNNEPNNMITLYRGAQFDEISLSFYNLQTVKNFSWNGMTSTTTNREIAEKFMQQNIAEEKIPVMFVIEVPMSLDKAQTANLLDIKSFSAFPTEDEVVLAPGSIFELKKYLGDKKGAEIHLILLTNISTLKYQGQIMHGTMYAERAKGKTSKIMYLEKEELAEAICHLKGNRLLEELEFSFCRYDADILNNLINILPTIPNLIKIAFLSSFSDDKTHYDMISKALNGLQIQSLQVSDASADDQQIISFVPGLTHLTSLKTLDLSFPRCHGITDFGFNALCFQGIGCLTSLTTLILKFPDSKITNECLDNLSSRVIRNLTSLTTLSLNFLRLRMTAKCLTCLFSEGIKYLTLLTSLSLIFQFDQEEELTDEILNEVFYEGIKDLTSLTRLDLNFLGGGLTDKVLSILSEGIRTLKLLISLNLNFRCNRITDVAWICGGIKNLTALTNLCLNFRSNSISDKSLSDLFLQGVKYLTSLTTLKLKFDWNRIEYTRWGTICSQGLKFLTSLTTLTISLKEREWSNLRPGVDRNIINYICSESIKYLPSLTNLNLKQEGHSYQFAEEDLKRIRSQRIKCFTDRFWYSHKKFSEKETYVFKRESRKADLSEQNNDLGIPLLDIESVSLDLSELHEFISSLTEDGRRRAQDGSLYYLKSLIIRHDFRRNHDDPEEGIRISFSKALKHLTSLGIENCNLQRLSLWIRLKDLPSLTNLVIEDESADDEDLILLAKEIRTLPTLKTLALNIREFSNNITDEGFNHFCSNGINYLTSLTQLFLSFYNCHQLTGKSLDNICLQVTKSLTSLTTLVISLEHSTISETAFKDLGMFMKYYGYHRVRAERENLKYESEEQQESEEEKEEEKEKDINLVSSQDAVCPITSKGLKKYTFKKKYINESSQAIENDLKITQLILNSPDQLPKFIKSFTEDGQFYDKDGFLSPLASLTIDLSCFNYKDTDKVLYALSSQGFRYLKALTILNLKFAGLKLKNLTFLASLTIEKKDTIYMDHFVELFAEIRYLPLTNLFLCFVKCEQMNDDDLTLLGSRGIVNLSSLTHLTLVFTHCPKITGKGVNTLCFEVVKSLPSLIELTFDFENCSRLSKKIFRDSQRFLKYFDYHCLEDNEANSYSAQLQGIEEEDEGEKVETILRPFGLFSLFEKHKSEDPRKTTTYTFQRNSRKPGFGPEVEDSEKSQLILMSLRQLQDFMRSLTEDGQLFAQDGSLSYLTSLTIDLSSFDYQNTHKELCALSSKAFKHLSSLIILDFDLVRLSYFIDFQNLSFLTNLAIQIKNIHQKDLDTLSCKGICNLPSLTNLCLYFVECRNINVNNLCSQGIGGLTSLTHLTLVFISCEIIETDICLQVMKLNSLAEFTLSFVGRPKISEIVNGQLQRISKFFGYRCVEADHEKSFHKEKSKHQLEQDAKDSLNLTEVKLSNEDILFLMQVGFFSHLRELNLNSTGLDTEKVKLLAQGNWLELESLDISCNYKIGDECTLQYLLTPNWHSIKKLVLKGTGLTSKGVKFIVDRNNWSELQALDISKNDIGDEGMEHLLTAKWHQLKDLILHDIKLTAIGVKSLAKENNWFELQNLDISGNNIEDEGIKCLGTREWTELTALNLGQITEIGVKNFITYQNAWPKLKKLYFNLKDCPDYFKTLKWIEIVLASSSCESSFWRTDYQQQEWEWKVDRRRFDLRNFNLLDAHIDFLAQTSFPRLESLGLSSTALDAEKVKLLGQGNWLQIQYLDLSYNPIGDEGIAQLVKGNWLALEALGLKDTKITEKGVKILAERNSWTNLKQINLSENEISVKAMWISMVLLYAKCPQIDYLSHENLKWPLDSTLQKVNLEGGETGNEYITKFLLQAPFPSLYSLNLKLNKINAQGLRLLAQQGNWPLLQKLDISENDIGDKGIESLGNWSRLEILILRHTKITQNGIKVITDDSKWPGLKKLDISANDIRDNGIKVLAQGKWPRLESLILGDTKITEKALKFIIDESKWPRLTRLDISANDIRDDGIKVLVQGKWPRLESLILGDTKITENALKFIIDDSKWPRLTRLDLSECDIGDEHIEILIKGKWYILKNLILRNTKITEKGAKVLLDKSCWTGLETLTLSSAKIVNRRIWGTQTSFCTICPTLNLDDHHISNNQRNCQHRKESSSFKNKRRITERATWDYEYEAVLGDESDASAFNPPGWHVSIEELVGTFSFSLSFLSLKLSHGKADTIKLLTQGNWPALQNLDLSRNTIGDEGIKYLISGEWPQLAKLNLSKNEITGQGIKILFSQNNFTKLKDLNLSFNNIDEESNEVLAEAKWPQLENLVLKSTGITEKSVKIIIERNCWTNLKTLDISYNSSLRACTIRILFYLKFPRIEKLSLDDLKTKDDPVHTKEIDLEGSDIDNEHIRLLVQASFPSLRSLSLQKNKINAEGIRLLVQGNWLSLQKLDLSQNEIGDEGIEFLIKGKWPELQNLILKETKITDHAIKIIIHESNWPQLKALDLSKNEIGDESGTSLAKGKWPQLESLILEDTKITEKGLKVLVNENNWDLLKELHIPNSIREMNLIFLIFSRYEKINSKSEKCTSLTQARQKINAEGIKSLVQVNLPSLRELDLSHNEIEDEGLELLIKGKWSQLESLILKDTKITEKGFKVLVNENNWALLQKLDISKNNIGDEGVEGLIQGKWPHLETLILSHTNITEKSWQAIANQNVWPNLQVLNLSSKAMVSDKFKWMIILFYCKRPQIKQLCDWRLRDTLDWEDIHLQGSGLGNEGVKVLVQASFPSLRCLNLSLNKIDVEGIRVLVQGNWPALQEFDLSQNEIGDEGVEFLIKGKWPELQNLILKETKITDHAIKIIIHESNWPQLKALDLSDNEIGDEIGASLAKGKWPLLASLSLRNTKITDKIVKHLTDENNCWSGWLKIDISENNIKDECLETSSKGMWSQLESIILQDTQRTYEEASILADKNNSTLLKRSDISQNNNKGIEVLIKGKWPQLKNLLLKGTEISPRSDRDAHEEEHMHHLNFEEEHTVKLFLANQASMPLLKRLDFNFHNKHIEGLKFLVEQSWSSLLLLDLSSNKIGDEGIKIVVRGIWPQLENLSLRNTNITEQGLKIMIYEHKWNQLQGLDLSENDLGDKGIDTLIKGKWPQLKTLILSDIKMTENGAKIIVKGNNWPILQRLDTSNNEIKDEGIYSLVTGKWPQLKHLILRGAKITQNGVKSMIDKNSWPALQTLDISENYISDAGITFLIKGQWTQLKSLALQNTKITEKAIEIMSEESNWPALQILDISNNEIRDEGVEHLLKGRWIYLENLNINYTKITEEGMKMMLEKNSWVNLKALYLPIPKKISKLSIQFYQQLGSSYLVSSSRDANLEDRGIDNKDIGLITQVSFPYLRVLNLRGNRITDEGISILVHGNWPILQELDLSKNEIGDEGSLALLGGKWCQLKKLDLSHTKVTNKGIKIMAERNKWVNLETLNISEVLQIGYEEYEESDTVIEDHESETQIFSLFCLKCPNFTNLGYASRNKIDLEKICYEDIRVFVQASFPYLFSLTLSRNKINVAEIKLLVQGNWPKLENLDLSKNDIEVEGIEILVERSNWPKLKTLNLSENNIEDEAVEVLARGNWPYLQNLDLRKTKVTKKGALIMARRNSWTNLERLYLYNDSIRDREYNHIKLLFWLKSPEFDGGWRKSSRQDKIDFEGIEIGIEDVKIIARILALVSYFCPRYLGIRLSKFNAEGLRALAQVNWHQLKGLDISENDVGDEGIESLIEGKWPHLESLILERIKITELGVKILSDGENWSQLANLSISDNDIGDQGIKYLAKGKWPHLKSLALSNVKITEEGIKTLVNESDWPVLQKLDLSQNKIGDKGIEFLSGGKWIQLKSLVLKDSGISSEGLELMIYKNNWDLLKKLDISKNKIRHKDIKYLVKVRWPAINEFRFREAHTT